MLQTTYKGLVVDDISETRHIRDKLQTIYQGHVANDIPGYDIIAKKNRFMRLPQNAWDAQS